ncbi:rhomboid family intramembrane serine protease [Halomarina ordinaria]|uniref:Rhomboid family intramembrane serine protease n=1 Tax=Halomarina ordinaria TaxID=3033939 RepID=A0ABD5UA47_9EURY|nr:rhomboid family intramembrane serine protease [Halomarina sp. PSRA2]
MATCDVCGKPENLPYRCRHCGGTFCGDHRLPEAHDCPGLQNWGDPSGVFDSGFDDSVNEEQSRVAKARERVTSTGGPLSYFRGNVSYLFLGVIILTFVAEQLVLAFSGVQLFTTLFVLSSENVEYVWTWVTAVFSHSPRGFFHIFGNAIVLFFFGPLVERYVGSRAFTALFLVSGVAAGLAQVTLGLLMGEPTAVLGASGAIMAILGVLTVLNPDLKVYLYFFIPIPIWVLTFGYAGLSLFGVFSTFNVMGNVAHFAHLIGLVIGLAYGEYARRQGVRATGQFQLGGGNMGGPGRGRGPF